MNKYDELVKENNELIACIQQERAKSKQIKNKISTLQTALDTLRVGVLYQVFDIEATRRENERLVELLEEKD